MEISKEPILKIPYTQTFFDIWHWDLELRRLNKLPDKNDKWRQIEIKSVEEALFHKKIDYAFEQNYIRKMKYTTS